MEALFCYDEPRHVDIDVEWSPRDRVAFRRDNRLGERRRCDATKLRKIRSRDRDHSFIPQQQFDRVALFVVMPSANGAVGSSSMLAPLARSREAFPIDLSNRYVSHHLPP